MDTGLSRCAPADSGTYGSRPWLAERLIRRSSRILPSEHRDRYVEEWLAELELVPGRLIKLIAAIRIAVRTPATSLALQGLTVSEALVQAVGGRLAGRGFKLFHHAVVLSQDERTEHRGFAMAWLLQNLTILRARLLTSVASVLFKLGFAGLLTRVAKSTATEA